MQIPWILRDVSEKPVWKQDSQKVETTADFFVSIRFQFLPALSEPARLRMTSSESPIIPPSSKADPCEAPSFEIIGHRETKLIRFIEAYLDRGNATDAARQLGYEGHTASNIGWRFLNEPIVQKRLSAYFKKHSQDREIARREILAGLYREANYFSRGANSLTRIRAWETLAKLTGVDQEEAEQKKGNLPLTSEDVRLIREEFDTHY